MAIETRVLFASSLSSLLLAGAVAFAVPQGPASQPAAGAASQPAGPKDDAATDKKSTKEVDIKKEVGVLEDVFRHRAALHYLKADKDAREAILKTIDPESASQVRAIVERDERFTALDYHFVEKIKNCEQRILERLRSDKFQGLADLLEAVKGKEYPRSAAFANLLGVVETNFRYATRKGLVGDADMVKELTPKLAAEAARIEGTAGHPFDEIAKALNKDTKAEDFPASWFDPTSEVISYEFGEIPVAKGFPKVDLASATKDDLTSIPGLEPEMADGILKYRKRNGIVGVEELRFVEEIPARLVEPLASVMTAARATAAAPRPKKWTVMVYLNAANNLEPFGLKDMNEMETIGSTQDVNVVVECARFRGKQAVKPNGQYLSNPYSEFSGAFYFGLDNSPGTRRYYILKDDDKTKVRSVMVENVGETDAGRPEPLAEFGKWAAEQFPAEHYALIIWDHGAGWSGVSYDDNTHHGMDMPEVREACEKICESLKKQGKERIDVLDFDACLMATLEVGYELRNTVDFLAASQEVEPGDGNPYGEMLKWLTQYPEAPAAAVCKAIARTYVDSYAPEGVQTDKDGWYGAETKSAIRLSRMADLRTAVESVAKLLEGKRDLLGDVAEEIVRESRKFGRLVDIQDFFAKVAAHEKSDAALKEAIERVNEQIGYPNDGKDKLVNEVVISRRSAGNVIWGFNGWATPPRNLAPFVHQARFAKTPLVGPDEKGNYVAKLKFPPMLRNPKSAKQEWVKEINYRFDDDSEKRTVKDFDNTFFTTNFQPDAAVIAEGHNIGNNRSHGISLYFPAYLGFDKEYRRLQFSEGSAWAALCEKFPLKKIEKPAAIALLGINHATKGDREKLGALVVREDLEKKLRAHDWAAAYREDFGKLAATLKDGGAFDVIRDPRPYGLDWLGVLEAYQGSTVILDNHSGGELGTGMDFSGSPRIVAPEGRHVRRFLQGGGRLLLGTDVATRALWDTPLYRETLGLEYVEKWDRDYAFTLPGASTAEKASDGKESRFEIEPARKGAPITVFARRGDEPGVEPFAVLPNGAWIGAKIARTDPESGRAFRAVVLGFYLTDLKSADQRRAVLKEALAFLNGSSPAPIEARKPEPSGGVGAATHAGEATTGGTRR